MRRPRRRAVLLTLGCLLTATGCDDSDRDGARRLTALIVDRARQATARPPAEVASRLSALHLDWDRLTLDARVGARLRWDKALADAKITVRATGGTVELTGTVADKEVHDRAVDLAKSTGGVEAVEDKLEVSGQ